MGGGDAVGHDAVDDEADDAAEAEAQVGETGQAGGEAVLGFEDGGDGGEHEIDVAVGDGAEEGHEEDDGRANEQLGGAGEREQEDPFRGTRLVMDRIERWVVGFLAQKGGFSA